SGQRHDVAIRGHARIDGVDPDHGRAVSLGTDGLVLPDDAAFDLDTFTIELWILRHDQGGTEVAVMSDFAEGTWELTLGLSGQPIFRTTDNSLEAGVIPVDVWTHLAVVRDDDGAVCIYTNAAPTAVCDEAFAAPVPPGAPKNWGIGSRPDGTLAPLSGAIDALRISDRARTESELAISRDTGGAAPHCGDLVVSELEDCEPNAACCSAICKEEVDGCGDAGCRDGVCDLTSCAAPPTRGLLALYELDEGSGIVAHDTASTSEPLDLALSGAAALTGDGLALDGGRAIPAGDPSRLIDAIKDSDALTIDVWLTTASTTAEAPFVPIVGLSPEESITAALGIDTGSSATYAARIVSALTSDGQPSVEGPIGDAPLDQRTHVVVTRTAEGLRSLYVNGKLRSVNRVGGDIDWTGGTVELGARAVNGETWSGVLHRVAIHAVALDAGEVAASYWAGRAE
ncbi:MAG TPA: LamG domain-containing protein, partial [Kofleriaceae bacterium]|nr:LamG domain-containing protein [Kofleriaceae bacterium]